MSSCTLLVRCGSNSNNDIYTSSVLYSQFVRMYELRLVGLLFQMIPNKLRAQRKNPSIHHIRMQSIKRSWVTMQYPYEWEEVRVKSIWCWVLTSLASLCSRQNKASFSYVKDCCIKTLWAVERSDLMNSVLLSKVCP